MKKKYHFKEKKMNYHINYYSQEENIDLGLDNKWPNGVVAYASVGHPGSCVWMIPSFTY